MNIARDQRYEIFGGIYTGSEKVPDLALDIKNNMGVGKVKFVVEVGFLETYEELVQDAKLWFGGNETVLLVMLVKLEEDPCYWCSIRDLTEREFAELEFPPRNEIEDQPFTISGPYGPAEYKGFKWVGKIAGIFEFWTLDPDTRLASRIMTGMVSKPLTNVIIQAYPCRISLIWEKIPEAILGLANCLMSVMNMTVKSTSTGAISSQA